MGAFGEGYDPHVVVRYADGWPEGSEPIMGREAVMRQWEQQREAFDADTVELIKKQKGSDGTKVINLIKSIQKTAEENSGDPFLIAMAERAKAVLELFEDSQTSTADALADIVLPDHEGNDVRLGDLWTSRDGPVALVWLRHYG